MELISTNKKDIAMTKAGATREAGWGTVVKGLNATKTTIDKFGDEHTEEDIPTQLRSAEIILKATGDIRPDVVVDNRSVTVSIGGSASEVKALLEMVSHVKSELSSLKTSGKQTGEIIDV